MVTNATDLNLYRINLYECCKSTKEEGFFQLLIGGKSQATKIWYDQGACNNNTAMNRVITNQGHLLYVLYIYDMII